MTAIGITFTPDQPPERLRAVALGAQEAGLPELWLWEDCFAEAGVSAAAAVLGWTDRLRVGIGLLPVPLRNVALTAMELQTIARLFPGRLIPGVGHGVLDWMGQVGARAASPLTLLAEYTTALRALLDGEEVTTEGRYVKLRQVRLAWPPLERLPLLVGGAGPKTVALAGRLGDGLMLGGNQGFDVVTETIGWARTARAEAGIQEPLQVVAPIAAPVNASASDLTGTMEQLIELGATSIPVYAAAEDGTPAAGDGLEDLLVTVADAARRVG